MANFAIVNFSDLGNRWDAEFHLIRLAYKDRTAVIAKSISKETVINFFSRESVSIEVLRLLWPLTRGRETVGRQQSTREQLLRAVHEYPFLSFAIMEDNGSRLIKLEKQKLQEQADAKEDLSKDLENLLRVVAVDAPGLEEFPPPPTIDGIEPLSPAVRKAVAENAFVGSVVYSDGSTISVPAETSQTAYVADCWVFDFADWSGVKGIADLIGDGNVPVPRRREDLGDPVGYIRDLPGHKQNYIVGGDFGPSKWHRDRG